MPPYRFLSFLVCFFLIVGHAEAKEIRLGVTPGSHEQVAEEVAKLLELKGHTLKIITFSDYILPNRALADGDLDANSFQHTPYLEQQVRAEGYDLTVAGTNFIEPMGLYSRSLKSLGQLVSGNTVAIPNDPSNGGRALLLLAIRGIIQLDAKAGLTAGVPDITHNPKGLHFIELDAAQLPRSLDDVAVAAINTNYALEAGFNPVTDAITLEDSRSPYANIVVVKTEDKDTAWVADLIEAYQNSHIRSFIGTEFKGALTPAF